VVTFGAYASLLHYFRSEISSGIKENYCVPRVSLTVGYFWTVSFCSTYFIIIPHFPPFSRARSRGSEGWNRRCRIG
jgi:hypothetical protein